MTYLKHKTLPPGLEPGISRLGGGCPIHWATGASVNINRILYVVHTQMQPCVKNKISQLGGSNSRPPAYEAGALPLS